jgi:signal transduction histidine kinase
MRFTRSLRFRVAAAFAGVGGAVSLILAAALYFGALDAGERLIDETLSAEMQDYQTRRAHNPQSRPPTTATLLGYVSSGEVPEELRRYAPGQYRVSIGNTPYRLAVAEREGIRYYLLYNESLQLKRQSRLVVYLVGFVALMVAVSLGLALWLAERVIEPVKDLARRVREIGPDTPHSDFTADFSQDELGELARAFEQSLQRLDAFIERERAFTSDVSHELRTPLAVIRGAAEVLLSDEARPDKERQRLERIERAATEMADLSSALLAMAREKDDAQGGSADMAALLTETVDKLRPLLEGRPIEVTLAIQAHPVVAADPKLVVIVMANLVRNSFTFTERGTVRIQLDAQRLQVNDTGIGIPREDMGQVFQRLYKGIVSDGFGIGLSLVKRICDRYDWVIQLESEEGRGTRVLLTFQS